MVNYAHQVLLFWLEWKKDVKLIIPHLNTRQHRTTRNEFTLLYTIKHYVHLDCIEPITCAPHTCVHRKPPRPRNQRRVRV